MERRTSYFTAFGSRTWPAGSRGRRNLVGGRRGDGGGKYRFDVFHGIAKITPGVESTLERADASDALPFEEQRHTGAGGFVWSSTVQNDFAIARETVAVFLEFLGIDAKGAGDGFRIGFEIDGVAQIHDDNLFAGIR